jgi:hypothetical protein
MATSTDVTAGAATSIAGSLRLTATEQVPPAVALRTRSPAPSIKG